jgi:hypothetical protein
MSLRACTALEKWVKDKVSVMLKMRPSTYRLFLAGKQVEKQTWEFECGQEEHSSVDTIWQVIEREAEDLQDDNG